MTHVWGSEKNLLELLFLYTIWALGIELRLSEESDAKQNYLVFDKHRNSIENKLIK